MLDYAGYQAVVVDCFADEDTGQLAVEAFCIADLTVNSLHPLLAAVCDKHDIQQLVYGSGLECHLDTLDYLQQHWRLLGNSAAVFRRMQDKVGFFRLLAELEIPAPETTFTLPANPDGWLQKPLLGQGGWGISRCQPELPVTAEGYYWQRELSGQPMSMTFIAAADEIEVLGFNSQYTIQNGMQPYWFAGLVTQAALPLALQQLLCDWLARLVAATGLRGLGSVDFMVQDGQCYVLEINARPPASAQLYDSKSMPVFVRHLAALQDAVPASAISVSVCRPPAEPVFKPSGYLVVYADETMHIPEAMCWPQWVVDRPRGGAIIGKGLPICSIIARENDQAQVLPVLQQRRQLLEKLLITGS